MQLKSFYDPARLVALEDRKRRLMAIVTADGDRLRNLQTELRDVRRALDTQSSPSFMVRNPREDARLAASRDELVAEIKRLEGDRARPSGRAQVAGALLTRCRQFIEDHNLKPMAKGFAP